MLNPYINLALLLHMRCKRTRVSMIASQVNARSSNAPRALNHSNFSGDLEALK
jgi:hypothetical protein